MNFFNSLQQVVSEVTTSVSNLGLSPKRFPFSKDGQDDENPNEMPHGPQHQPQSHGRGSSRLGPMLLPTPGATASSHSARGVAGGTLHSMSGGQGSVMGRGKGPMGTQPHPNYQGPSTSGSTMFAPKKEKEIKPLPVLQCGDRYTYWPEYDPSQTW